MTTQEQGQGANPTQDLAPLKETATLVLKYARNLINDDRAAEFGTAVSLMAQRDDRIAKASQDSLLAAMMACVHLDLMPNTPEQYAFVIPYKRGNGYDAQFQVGYKGMAALAYRSDQIKSISADLVFEGEHFKVRLGTNRGIDHDPDYAIDRTDYDKVVAVYATAELENGATVFDVVSTSEIKKVLANVKAKSDGTPWKEWPEAMAKKTAVKRLLKLLPSSAKDNRLQRAAAFDSWSEAGKMKVTKSGDIIEGEAQKVDEQTNREKADKALAARRTVQEIKPTKVEEPK